MEDQKIVDLYFLRDEVAIEETQKKYGDYCFSIAQRILKNNNDAKECENDTYLRAWNSIPPQKPYIFSTFLGTITRGLSLDCLRKNKAKKRGGDTVFLSLDELEQCVADSQNVYDNIETEELAGFVSKFLRSLSEVECNMFLQRYWYFYSIKEISTYYGFTQSKVKMKLLRTRNKLYDYLKKEGVFE